MIETLLHDGIFALVLSADHVVKFTNIFKLAKIPFLIWCMHPWTLGSKLLAKNVLGNLTRSVSLGKSHLAMMFNFIVGGATL